MIVFSEIFKKILLFIVFLVLFFPIIQNKIGPIDVEGLNGYYGGPPQEPVINKSDWFSSDFQEKQEAYINSVFGLRNTCVRINNQIAFSLFNIAKANGVTIGKENFLYEKKYIDAYYGKDFIGEDKVKKLIDRIKFVSDTLKKINKQLLIIFAPGKATFYPEYIPDIYRSDILNTNYKSLSKQINESDVYCIDFNKWFIDNKNRSKYPLFPQYGIHWSIYGGALAADSIIKKIEFLRKIDMPNLIYDQVELKQPHGLDYDIASGMNILFKLKSYDMAYPHIIFEKDSAKTKPSVLTISDSFYLTLYDFGISNAFANNDFWYYNARVYPQAYSGEFSTDNLNHVKEIESHDVFIVMATEANLASIGWGFLEELEHYYKGDNFLQKKEKIKDFKKYILNDKKWMEDAKINAEKKGISIDSMITLDAIWAIEHQSN